MRVRPVVPIALAVAGLTAVGALPATAEPTGPVAEFEVYGDYQAAILPQGEARGFQMKALGTGDLDGPFTFTMSFDDDLTGLVGSWNEGRCEAGRGTIVCTVQQLHDGSTFFELGLAAAPDAELGERTVTATLTSPAFAGQTPSSYTDTVTTVVTRGEPGGRFSDLDDDGRADVVVKDAGNRLLLYPGNGAGGLGRGRVVGTGFSGQVVLPGDLDNDSYDDLLHLDAAGRVTAFSGTGTGSFRAPRLVLSGLRGWRLTGPGLWAYNEAPALLGISPSGRLYAFPNFYGELGDPVQIGRGWGAMSLVATGDLDGDGFPDVAVRDGANRLLLYPGTVADAGAGGLGAPRVLATGWAFGQTAAVGDLTGDGLGDVLGVSATGELFAYRGDGRGHLVGRGARVGTGWARLTVL